MIGRILSHYKVLDEISRGGMGIVYRAHDVKLKRDVALKVLPPELLTNPERKRRFVQEAQAAAALEHPHIAVVYEIDESDGVTFIAMAGRFYTPCTRDRTSGMSRSSSSRTPIPPAPTRSWPHSGSRMRCEAWTISRPDQKSTPIDWATRG